MRLGWWLFVAALCLAGSVVRAQQLPEKAYVPDFTGDISETTGAIMASEVSTALTREGIEAFTETNLKDQLKHEEYKEILKCADSSCVDELIAGFGIASRVYGVVRRLGEPGEDKWHIELSLAYKDRIKNKVTGTASVAFGALGKAVTPLALQLLVIPKGTSTTVVHVEELTGGKVADPEKKPGGHVAGPSAQPAASGRDHKGRGFSFFGGAACRWYDPNLDGDVDNLSIHGPSVGFELGAAYYFVDSFYIALNGQLLFSTGDPAVAYRVPVAGASAVANYQFSSFSSILFYSLDLEPRLRLTLRRFLAEIGVGIHLGGVVASEEHSYSPTRVEMDGGGDELVTPPFVQAKPYEVALRLSAGLALDLGRGFAPYVRWFTLLPSDVFDWGLSLGLEYRL